MATAIGVSSKKPNGAKLRSVRAALTTRLGAVAIRVIRPLIRAATDSGIISRARGMPVLATRPRTTGMNMATIPVELMNAPTAATTTISSVIRRVSLPLPKLASRVPRAAATPVATSASPTMKRPPIISTEVSAKPAMASLLVTISLTARARRTPSATASGRIRSLANATTAAARMATAVQASGVIMKLCGATSPGAYTRLYAMHQ